LIDQKGNPRITDFGLAKRTQTDSGLTGSGQIMGTPSYMPPEQAGGKRGEVGPAADVYALGATCYALVTGRPPFQAATAMDTVLQVISDEPVAPRRLNVAIPLDLETICLKCLEKEPVRRYSSAAALAQELARFLAGEPILARPVSAPERLWRWCRRRPVVATLGAAVATLVLFVAIAGPIAAVTQSQLRATADKRAKEALKAKDEAHEAQKAEAARRIEAEKASYEASTKAIEADFALAQSDLSQAENLHHLARPRRQLRALELLKLASGLKRDTENLAAKLGDDPAGLRRKLTQFWREEEPQLRSEAARWLGDSSLKFVYDKPFPLSMQDSFTMAPRITRSGLAVSDDGKWLAFLRFGSGKDPMSAAPRFVDIIEADSGEVHSFQVGSTSRRMNAIAFGSSNDEMLLAKLEPEASGRSHRLLYLIERCSRITGKVTTTVTLPLADVSPRNLFSTHPGRLVFSADRRKLLTVPTIPGTRATVWDLATAKPLREFEREFTPEAFLPGESRIVGMTGSDIVVRDLATGGTVKRWPMPDGLVSVMGNLRNTAGPNLGSAAELNTYGHALQPDAQSLLVSPDGRWLAAFGQRAIPNNVANGIQMPTTVFLLDAETGQIRVRIPVPDLPSRLAIGAPAPPLAFDPESRLLALATTKSLALFSVPDGAPLISGPLPDMGTPIPGPAGNYSGTGVFTMPTSLVIARGTNRLFAAARPSDLMGSPIGQHLGMQAAASARPVVEAVFSWDLALPRTSSQDLQHEGIVLALQRDPHDRFIATAGDDRMVRAWEKGGGLRWSVGYPGAGSLFSHSIQVPKGHLRLNGFFDPKGGVFFTQVRDRIDMWDATSGDRRGSVTSVLTASPDNRYLAVAGGRGAGAAPARELRIIDVSRSAAILSIPVEADSPVDRYGRFGLGGTEVPWPIAAFSPDAEYFVGSGLRKPNPERSNSSVLVANLAQARVVARLDDTHDWAIGPAGRALVVNENAGGKSVLRAYALGTGKPIGKPTSGTLAQVVASQDFSSLIAPDDSKMVLITAKNPPNQMELEFAVWQFDNDQKIPITGNWIRPNSIGKLAYFDASGTRLIISAAQKARPGEPQKGRPAIAGGRAVVELWDLTGPRRLMSTADVAPELHLGLQKLSFDPKEAAFVTYHDPAQNTDHIGAIMWETATGKVLGRFKGTPPFIRSPDQDYFQLSDDRGNSTLISFRTREALAIPGRYAYFFGVPGLFTGLSEVTSQPKLGQITRVEPQITLTDLETGRKRAVLPRQQLLPLPFTDMNEHLLPGAYSPDGARFATLARQNPFALNVWEVRTGKLLQSVPLASTSQRVGERGRTQEFSIIGNVHFSPDGKRLAFSANDRFRVLDIETGRVLVIDDRPGHSWAIRAVVVSPDGALIASAGDDAAVCLWEAASGRFAAMLEEETNPIATVAFGADGRSLAARTATGRVRVWRFERTPAGDRIKISATPTWDTTSLGSSAGSPATSGPVFVDQGRLVAFGAGDGTIALRDPANGRIKGVLKPESGQAAVVVLAAGHDGKSLASADAGGIIRIWKPSTDTPPKRLVTGDEAIRALALAGNLIAVAGSSLDLWDVDRGERLLTLVPDARAVNCLELTADGRTLASGDNRNVKLRDLDELRHLLREIDLGW
jgi:WD40 repeat protein